MKPDLEEAMVTMREVIPRTWWNIYQGCLESGFSPLQSMQLLHTYILAQNPNGIVPGNGSIGPDSDNPQGD